MGDLKSTFKKAHDAFGKVATLGGYLLLFFFGGAAGAYAASHVASIMAAKAATVTAATNGGALSSFWSGLVTNPVTGETGIGPGLVNILHGWGYLGQAAGHEVVAGVNAVQSHQPVWEALKNSWNAPLLQAA